MIVRHGIDNPIICVDEIEKAGTGTHNGNLLDALLNFTEIETASSYFDECLLETADLSTVNWVAIANRVDTLPPALRSQFELVHCSAPSEAHFPVLIQSTMIEIAKRLKLPSGSELIDAEEQE